MGVDDELLFFIYKGIFGGRGGGGGRGGVMKNEIMVYNYIAGYRKYRSLIYFRLRSIVCIICAVFYSSFDPLHIIILVNTN